MRPTKRRHLAAGAAIPALAFALALMNAGCPRQAPPAPGEGNATARAEKEADPGGNGHEHSGKEHACGHGEGEEHPPCPECSGAESEANWLIDIGEHAFLYRGLARTERQSNGFFRLEQ